MNNWRPLIFVPFILGFWGCGLGTFFGHLYPVEGPLAAQTPPPVYIVKLTGEPGSLTVILPGAETCTGRWRFYFGSAFLVSGWDRVYGVGYYDQHVRGSPYFSRSVLKCDKGSSLEVEILQPSPRRTHFVGIARDQNYNLFKAVFDK